jgi:hypothetical protein
MHIDTEKYDIIKRDYEKNHSDREYDFNRMLHIFENIERVGWLAFKHGAVLITYKPYNVDTVEFHCHNGGSKKDLIAAVNAFNNDMSDTYFFSVTFYDNPVINELLKHSDFPCEFKKIDQGIDQTYEANFRLRRK